MLKNLYLQNNKKSSTKATTKTNNVSVSKSIDKLIKRPDVNKSNNSVLNMFKANFNNPKNYLNLYSNKLTKQNTRITTNENNLQRLNTFSNKNKSKEQLFTETNYVNTVETTDRNFMIPNKLKQKVSNIRLYSKPKFGGSLISDQFKSMNINVNNYNNINNINTIRLKTNESISEPIRIKKNNHQSMYDVKKVANLNRKAITKNKPKEPVRTEYHLPTEESEGALSVNEVKDLVKVFDFRNYTKEDNSLFSIEAEKIYTSTRRDKYYDYFFRGVIDNPSDIKSTSTKATINNIF
jgi:hypothetical protein